MKKFNTISIRNTGNISDLVNKLATQQIKTHNTLHACLGPYQTSVTDLFAKTAKI